MNMPLLMFIILVLGSFFSVNTCSASSEESLLGWVTIRSNNLKLDGQAKKEIAKIASKIRKIKVRGAIKIRGDYPVAGDPEEYLIKSVFMAREVEQQLKLYGAGKHQLFLVASRYKGVNRSGKSIVELFLYPHELEEIQIEHLQKTFPETASDPVKELRPEISQQPFQTSQRPAKSSEQATDRFDSGMSKVEPRRGKPYQPEEDPKLANELVRRAKAKAAERARRGD
jgi:hypothetical protein